MFLLVFLNIFVSFVDSCPIYVNIIHILFSFVNFCNFVFFFIFVFLDFVYCCLYLCLIHFFSPFCLFMLVLYYNCCLNCVLLLLFEFFWHSWSHRLRPKKLQVSVAVLAAPVRATSQRPHALSVT